MISWTSFDLIWTFSMDKPKGYYIHYNLCQAAWYISISFLDIQHVTVSFRNSCLWPKWLWRCRKSGHHPEEDLAKYGYKPNMKYKSLAILLYFGMLTKCMVLHMVLQAVSFSKMPQVIFFCDTKWVWGEIKLKIFKNCINFYSLECPHRKGAEL